MDKNGIRWIRPKPMPWIDSSGKRHNYFADFYLPDYDLFLDPKNEYCFKVQAEKIDYILRHYDNVRFMREDELTLPTLLEIIAQYQAKRCPVPAL